MTEMAQVRVAGQDDVQEIFRLFLQGHRENGLFPYDLDKVYWWISRMVAPEHIPEWDTGPRGVIGVIGEPNNLEGLAFLTIGCFWYTNHRHLEEFIVYVDPKYRRNPHGKQHGKALINWMKQQSLLTGMPLLTGVLSTHRTEAKVRMYEQMLPKAGAFFCFDPVSAVTTGSSISLAVH